MPNNLLNAEIERRLHKDLAIGLERHAMRLNSTTARMGYIKYGTFLMGASGAVVNAAEGEHAEQFTSMLGRGTLGALMGVAGAVAVTLAVSGYQALRYGSVYDYKSQQVDKRKLNLNDPENLRMGVYSQMISRSDIITLERA